MVNDLFRMYRPITANPFSANDDYVEIPPSKTLAPYVRCFWGTKQNSMQEPRDKPQQTLVIPDTCVDIIVEVDFTNHKISHLFCGIQDTSFQATPAKTMTDTFTFAIRFYAWAVLLFADENMTNSLNILTDTEEYFHTFKQELEDQLINSQTIGQRIELAEHYLVSRLRRHSENSHIMNAVYKMLGAKGNIQLGDLVQYTGVSKRQLERLFKKNIGISPKKLATLIRYQYLWQDIIKKDSIDIAEAVVEYGFYDQAHLLNDFKKYHKMTPFQAKNLHIIEKNSL
ncbi:helix-turn-helix domain-containing protein [Amphibacillus sp. Q70]|uniref:helix-turn-helix domain-containing protein n=1 Tax=Amphibacillus sp. Q70 TaxID=3453416 RepID=UPI003F82B5EB